MRNFQTTPLALCLLVPCLAQSQTNTNPITRDMVISAQKLIGLNFSQAKVDMLLPGLQEQLAKFEAIRKFPLSNSVPPAIWFDPLPVGMKFECGRRKFKMSSQGKVKLPANLDDLAFYSIGELAALIKTHQITSEKPTRFFLDRLKKYGPKLECVVTLTEELALQQARKAGQRRRLAEGFDHEFQDSKFNGRSFLSQGAGERIIPIRHRLLTELLNSIQELIVMRRIVMEDRQTLYLSPRGPLQSIQERAVSPSLLLRILLLGILRFGNQQIRILGEAFDPGVQRIRTRPFKRQTPECFVVA